jgi:hypothetical protein
VATIVFDLGTARSEPPVPLAAEALRWVAGAFRHAGADPTVGARLALILRAAGLSGVRTFGVQAYLAPDDPAGPALLAGVTRSLAPTIVAAGLATEDELALDTLEERFAHEIRSAGAAFLPPAVVGAWGRRA